MVLIIKYSLSGKSYCLNSVNPKCYIIKEHVSCKENVPADFLYVTKGCLPIEDDVVLPNNSFVEVTFKGGLLGGKGGFGSMLRAIGAQIEKTTNREACRDLSGRRLRDINEEKRLKQWITKQAEREEETKRKKQEKLDRIRGGPKHQFHDPDYDQQRSELAEKIDSALEEGLKKSIENEKKRKSEPPVTPLPLKKTCLWGLEELSDSDLSSEEETEALGETCKIEILNLGQYQSIEELEALGEDVIASELKVRGLKSGGDFKAKAERLWALRFKGTDKGKCT